ncbi:MAG: hypothetical protein RLZZ274_952 [Cyanobacteriota bacterium]|jgi:hypothetical protein|nr:DUF2949 domain-containing protein [Cyanobium sp. WKJ7-Wakatipu]
MALASCCAADQHGLSGAACVVISTSSQPPPSAALLRLLRNQFGLSESALALGLRQAQQEQAPLPVVLWRFGLISLEQFDALLSWQDQE